MYYKLNNEPRFLQDFVKKLVLGLSCLSTRNIVHCDFKLENILCKISDGDQCEDLKIIDFGSGFYFGSNNLLTITTPEYLSPEFLGLFVGRKNINNDAKNEFLKKKLLPWSIDVWSLGVNILEALIGIPIWMSFKCKKMHKGKPIFTTGFFSATGKTF